ncbi:hypothetical protein CROQUDRAFT_667193 [Cronartium quercuum f. sp. fusiforme G11]|uniref:Uncharacterized protein n=1 Tax=Cronartium quercuum f. sp. fusiforme G11 TaxID=708437 RepID=A0A9P6TGZ7_9BASI|nr:hypothetical protein CROQUDRAFT_672636 [Cronartium quercuum f. sp. fusiforme G11]KAG0152286.1 hypothetical protein CROQUDRAFT_667193 [Cronartium quercuum f. sp. fusiforme G11]
MPAQLFYFKKVKNLTSSSTPSNRGYPQRLSHERQPLTQEALKQLQDTLGKQEIAKKIKAPEPTGSEVTQILTQEEIDAKIAFRVSMNAYLRILGLSVPRGLYRAEPCSPGKKRPQAYTLEELAPRKKQKRWDKRSTSLTL